MSSEVWLQALDYEVGVQSSPFISSRLTYNAVILDCHPIFTTIIILVGWAVKAAVAMLVSRWLGADQKSGEAWIAYSIP